MSDTPISMPQIRLSQPLIIGLAITAGVVAYVLWLENKKLRNNIEGSRPMAAKKPCNCDEKSDMQSVSNLPSADVTPTVEKVPDSGVVPTVVVD